MIVKDGKINWICFGADCPSNCCGPTSNVLHGSKPKTWQALQSEIPENTVPAFGSQNLKEEGLVYYQNITCHIRQSDELGCYFLKDEGCSQYQNRGYSCKSYPFFMDKYQGICIDDSCPGVGAGWTDVDEIKPMLENLRALLNQQFEVALTLLENTKT